MYNYTHTDGQRPSGGSSILVYSSCPQREIKLITTLQAVTVSVTLEKEITICAVYIPPSFHSETEHLETLLKQLSSPYILVGDFNGHNILWGCKENNHKGNIFEDFISTCLPWVASRKLEEGVLEVEGCLEYGISDA